MRRILCNLVSRHRHMLRVTMQYPMTITVGVRFIAPSRLMFALGCNELRPYKYLQH